MIAFVAGFGCFASIIFIFIGGHSYGRGTGDGLLTNAGMVLSFGSCMAAYWAGRLSGGDTP